MAVQSDFIAAVNQIAAERNIDPNEVLDAIAEAIKSGFESNYPEESAINIQVNINQTEGSISVVQVFEVVEEVVNDENQITLAEAEKKYNNADLEVGDIVEVDVTPEGDFGRVAAQAAKQVILQKVRESERNTQLAQYEDKIGEVEFAVVQRMDRDRVLWEVGRTLAVMEADERIPGEFYKSGTRHKVLLQSIEETPRGRTLFVSRSSVGFLRALFDLEVPELESESVEIKGIAREAGSRSKVAVHSNVDGIDPIGSFVGQRGVRITSVMNELKLSPVREEKIDIILWSDNDEEYIANAISPAEAKKVNIIDPELRHAEIFIPEDQVSLAIGRDGQNARLAAKLTGYKLDIVSADSGEVISGEDDDDLEMDDDSADTDADSSEETTTVISEDAAEAAEEHNAESLADIEGISGRTASALADNGIKTLKDLKSHEGDFSDLDGIGPKSVEEITELLEK